MIPTILTALLLTQTMPEARGAVLALHAAEADLSNRTITYPFPDSACVSFPNGVKPPGTVTIRVGVALLSEGTQVALGAAPLLDGEGKPRPWVYGAMEIQSVPSPGDSLPPLPSWVRILETDEVSVQPTPYQPQCEILLVREGFTPSVWRCACRGSGVCNWTPPLQGGGFGASTTLPKNLTAPPGTWSGAGCVNKPCVAYEMADSMPTVCK